MISPKRKRGSDSTSSSSPASKVLPQLSTEINQHAKSEPNDTGSPRSVVAGNLQQLDLSGPLVQRLSYKDAGRARKRFAQASPEPQLETPSLGSLPKKSSLADHSSIITSFPTIPLDSEPGNGFWDQESPTKFSKPRARSVSPPLDGDPEENSLTWHESEITGHNPKDPEDDGYGINGIGFKPTAAMVRSRSQKRKQQIAEYRSREAREARQRRSERRQHENDVPAEEVEGETRRKSRVRFDEAVTEED